MQCIVLNWTFSQAIKGIMEIAGETTVEATVQMVVMYLLIS